MAYTQIINKAYDLAEELKASPYYQKMVSLDQAIKEQYAKEMADYQKTFQKFDEVFSAGGNYHPDFKKVSSAYQAAKEKLFNKEEVKEYFLNERKLNEILEEISKEITESVSNYNDLKGGVCSWT